MKIPPPTFLSSTMLLPQVKVAPAITQRVSSNQYQSSKAKSLNEMNKSIQTDCGLMNGTPSIPLHSALPTQLPKILRIRNLREMRLAT